jgi:hypothetical protein
METVQFSQCLPEDSLLASINPIPSNHITELITSRKTTPNTGGFILRVFSSAPVVVEQVAYLFHVSATGDWRRTAEVRQRGRERVSE